MTFIITDSFNLGMLDKWRRTDAKSNTNLCLYPIPEERVKQMIIRAEHTHGDIKACLQSKVNAERFGDIMSLSLSSFKVGSYSYQVPSVAPGDVNFGEIDEMLVGHVETDGTISWISVVIEG